jgi:hypothetical protein
MGKIKKRDEKSAGRVAAREMPGVSFQDEPPKFSLRYVQSDYCITQCEAVEQLDFIKAMIKRKDVPWKELEKAPHGGLGCEVIRKLNVILPKCAEGKSIIAFRYSGEKPMVGFRERDVFYILWFDRSFSVYKH